MDTQDIDLETLLSQNSKNAEFEVEKEIISAMLLDPSLISFASTRLTKNDFSNVILRIFYTNIIDLYNQNEKTISLDFIKERIHSDFIDIDQNDYDSTIDQLSYNINQLSIDDFKKYVDIKKCQSIQREFISFSNKLSDIKLSTKNIEQKLNELNSDFFSITSSWVTNAEGKTLKSLIEKINNDLKNKSYREDNNQLNKQFNGSKYNWCLKSVNDLLDGFNNKQLYVLAARPGMGKSTLALNWAVAYAERAYLKNKKLSENDKKHCVLFFSLEMSADQLTDKVISLVSYIDNYKIQKRILDESDRNRYLYAIKNFNLDELPLIFMDDGNYSLSKIESIVREESSKYIIDLVVVDYLQLIKVGDDRAKFNMNRTNEVAVISKTLKTMALTLDIPILSLSQLSRRVETNGGEVRKPMLSDLRESGSIEQDADVVMFLYVDEKAQSMIVGENDRQTFGITFAVEKNRFGAKGIRELEFAKYCSRFDDNGVLANIQED